MVVRDDRPQVMSVTEVLQHNVDRLVDILKAELKIAEQQLQDRLHARTLEQIFIENRVYQVIEDMTTSAKVIEAVLDGLEPYQDQIKRAVSREDVEALLKIPIRRISLYDIDRAKKERREMRVQLREVGKNLAHIIPYAIAIIEGLIEKYRKDFPRRTEIVSFEKVDVREAAKRDLKLRYDRDSGYLGYEVNGQAQFEVSPYDRVLVIRKDGIYSVVDVPDKLFVGTGMLHCSFVDRDLVFNVLYKERKGCAFIKRCRIDKFILNKTYALVPEDGKLLKLTINSDRKVSLDYKPKPRLRVLKEEFPIAKFPVRGLRAGGIRLSARELKSCKIV